MRIYWPDEAHVCVESDVDEERVTTWIYTIKYPEGRTLFAFSDGSLVSATRKGGKPKIEMFESSSSPFREDGDSLTIDGDITWVARAWDYATFG